MLLFIGLIMMFLLIACDQKLKNIEDAVPNSQPKPGIEGEFVVVEDPRAYQIPGPPCPVTRAVTMRWQAKYYRAVITEKGNLMLLEAHGKEVENGESLIGSNTYGEDGLLSRTFYVMDCEFTIECDTGWLVGKKREEMYLSEAQKTVNIIYSGEKIRITGKEAGVHFILKGLKKFSVSNIEKI